MSEKERIKVYVKIVNGKTVCICHKGRKGCGDPCDSAVVERDRFDGWDDTFRRNRYGK